MKTNYYNEMEKIIEKLEDRKPGLLLHTCCAPCASHVLSVLEDFFDITVYFYNPNIYPKEEYFRRAKELEKFLAEYPFKKQIPLLVEEYIPEEFEETAVLMANEKEGGKRCAFCFKLRLEKTALKAKEQGIEFFTTTLTISPHKNSALLNEIGKETEVKYGVKYLPGDFKKKEGYKHSIELSKEFNLYRQEYCGCKYSMDESRERKASNESKEI